MRADPRFTRTAQGGMSLVEILVGVAIGVIGILAIFQTVAVWNKHSQTTAAGGDAQIAGTLALFNLERDLKEAGHGFGTAPMAVMGCDVTAEDTTTARIFNFGLRPVDIAASGGGAPDEINVLYGDSSFYVDKGEFTAATATSKRLRRRGGFKPGDVAVVASPGASAATATCQLVEITADTNPDGYTVDHAMGAYASFYGASGASRYNPAGGTGATFTAGTMYNLGPRPWRNNWRIVGNRALARTDLMQGTASFQVAAGVINLKAQYGIDADANGQIADAEWTTTVTPTTDWTRVLAIRVAVLVRSRQYERSGDPAASTPSAVTTAAPTWAGGTFLMTNVDGSADSGAGALGQNNWRNYRYRVYERVIPMRNMIWGTW